MKSISTIVAAGMLLAAPALANAEEAHFQIVGEPEFQGDCGGDAVINTLEGNPSIDILSPSLSVEANDQTPRSRKLCNVRVRVKIDPGYKLSLSNVFYEGWQSIDKSGGSGNVSARAYFQGLQSIHGFRAFRAGEAPDNFTVTVDRGTGQTVCGGETYLNLLVDLTARQQPGNGQFSEVVIQRGAATPGDPSYKSRIQCGVEQDTCN